MCTSLITSEPVHSEPHALWLSSPGIREAHLTPEPSPTLNKLLITYLQGPSPPEGLRMILHSPGPSLFFATGLMEYIEMPQPAALSWKDAGFRLRSGLTWFQEWELGPPLPFHSGSVAAANQALSQSTEPSTHTHKKHTPKNFLLWRVAQWCKGD